MISFAVVLNNKKRSIKRNNISRNRIELKSELFIGLFKCLRKQKQKNVLQSCDWD